MAKETLRRLNTWAVAGHECGIGRNYEQPGDASAEFDNRAETRY